MLEELKSRIESNLESFNQNIEKPAKALKLSKEWIATERAQHGDNPASVLLDAARLSAIESCSSWAIGLNRGAASSIRTYTESAVSWLYYKDHPVEFGLVKNLISDLKLPKAIQVYLKEIDKGFEKSYGILRKYMNRSDEYFYTNVSSYAHAHPAFLLDGKDMSELVVSNPPTDQFMAICQQLDEFIHDQYTTHFRHSWDTVPSICRDDIKTRLGVKLQDFLSIPSL